MYYYSNHFLIIYIKRTLLFLSCQKFMKFNKKHIRLAPAPHNLNDPRTTLFNNGLQTLHCPSPSEVHTSRLAHLPHCFTGQTSTPARKLHFAREQSIYIYIYTSERARHWTAESTSTKLRASSSSLKFAYFSWRAPTRAEGEGSKKGLIKLEGITLPRSLALAR